MPDRVSITDEITIGAQPSEAELKAMAQDGYRSIINLRHQGEDLMPLPPDQEGQAVRELNMEYIHIPVSMADVGDETVDRFRQALEQAPKPVYVHCKLGKRAGAFTMMALGARQGLSGQQVLQRAEQMGMTCDEADMEQFVRDYANRHSQ